MFIYSEWEEFCKELDNSGINSVSAASLLDKNSNKNCFLVLKHDVETNPKKALELAKIESRYNHQGSYYVQGYLLENAKYILILQEILKLGHEVSFHHDVMDSNRGDIGKAKLEFENYLKLFKRNGFVVKTVCQHGNPLVEREGFCSNRDFFRDAKVRNHFDGIYEIMVNFKAKIESDYKYISDSGYGWKAIFDAENNDINDSSNKDIPLKSLNEVFNNIVTNKRVIISTHPHRWNKSGFKAKMKKILFNNIKIVAKVLYKVPILKKIMGKYYFLAKKI